MPTGIGSGIAGEVFTDQIGSGSGGSTICPTRYSVNFNGSTQLGTESGTSFDLGVDNFSYSFWFKTSTIGVSGILHTDSTADGMDIFLSSTGLLTVTWTTVTFPTTASLNDGEWHHAVLSVDRLGYWRWYIDGVNTNSADHSSLSGDPVSNTAAFWGAITGSDLLDGNLTELSIWGTALSSSEVLTIYNNMFGSQTCLTDLTFSSGNLIQNGSFNEIGPQLIDNPTFNAPTSPDLIVNGDFTDTGADEVTYPNFTNSDISQWFMNSGRAAKTWDAAEFMRLTFAIADGKAMYASFGHTLNASYKVTMRVRGTKSDGTTAQGSAFDSIGDPNNLGQVVSNPTLTSAWQDYEFYVVSTNSVFRFYLASVAIGDLVDFDSISVKELGAGWIVPEGWEVVEDKVNSVSGNASLTQDVSAQNEKIYKVSFNLSAFTSGTLYVDIGSSVAQTFTTTGVKTLYFSSLGIGLLRFYGGAFIGSITNVSVQEVDWAFGGGWSLGSNKALATAAVGGDTLSQTGVFTLDKSYKTTFLSTMEVGDNCFAEFGSDGFIGQLPTGTASNLFYYQTNEVGDSARIAFEVQSIMTGSISNVLTYQMDPNGYWNIPTANSTQLVLNPTFTNTGPEEVTNGDFSQTALGPEEVVDGDFPSGTTAWSFSNSGGLNGWSISSNRAICDSTAATPFRNLNSSTTLVNGISYKLTIDILQSADNMKVLVGSTTLAAVLPTGTNLGYEYNIDSSVHSGGVFGLYAGSSDLQEIDNVSIKEVLQEVSNGDFTDTGSELVVNGDFLSASSWNVNSNWNINTALGVAEADGLSNNDINQSVWLPVIGKSYKVTFEVVSRSQGDVLFILGGVTGQTHNTLGIKTEYIVATSTDRLKIDSQSLFIGSVKDVSVKELGADWTVTMSDGSDPTATKYVEFVEAGARFVSDVTAAPHLYLEQSTLSSGKLYKFTCNVAYTDSGVIKVYVGGESTSLIEGVNTIYSSLPTTATTLRFLRNSNDVDCIISNVSVQELGEGWTLGTGWSIGEDKAIHSTTTGSAARLQQTGFTNTASYKIDITIANKGTNAYRFFDGGASTVSLLEGTNTYYVTGLLAGIFIIEPQSSDGSDVEFSNISVEETGLDWVSPDAGVVNTFSATGLTMTSVNGAGDNTIQQVGVTADDQAYKVDYNIVGSSLTAGNYLQFYNGATYVNMKTTVGSHILHFTRSGADDSVFLKLASTSSTTDTVDIGSITIVEVQGWTLEDGKLVGDLPDLAKSATQDIGAIAGNSYKATMDVAIAEEELITNGSFRQVGTNVVDNPNFTLGTEEAIPLTSWTAYISGSGTSTVTYDGSTAELNIDASNSNVGIYQPSIFELGKSYKIVLSMKATASFDAEILESSGPSTINTIGTVSLTTSYQDFTFYYVGTGTYDLFIHRLFSASGASQTISIQTVSVKEVDGWSIQEPTGQTVEFNGTQVHINYDSSATQGSTGINQATLDADKSYKIVLDIASLTGDAGDKLRVQAGGVVTDFSDAGIKTFYVKTVSGPLYIVRASNGTSFETYINSISVQEVGQGWTLGTGWSIGDDVASCDGTASSSLYQNVSGVENKTYKITGTVSNYTSGTLQVGGSSNALEVFAAGPFIHYRVWTNDPNLYLKSKPGDGFSGSITNISVEEVGELKVDIGGAPVQSITTSGTHSLTFTAVDSDPFRIYGSTFTGSVTNIFVTQVAGDTLERWWRVNGDIDTLTDPAPNVASNAISNSIDWFNDPLISSDTP